MELRPQLMLQSVAKSLTDIIIPAVDPNNKLAQEQSRLILGLVQIVISRLPLMYRYDRHELERFVALANTLTAESYHGDLATQAAARLDAVKASSADVLDRARAEPSELEGAVLELRAAISALIRGAHAADDSVSAEAVREHVFKAAKEQLDRERAWVLPYGFEADPSVVASIESLLDPVPKRG